MLNAIVLALFAASSVASQQPQTRCGWIDNPTPANWWLTDRDGEWTLSVQGGYQADGWEDAPDLSGKDWVETNGSYGYGCACAKVTVDRASGHVLKIYSGRSVPLRQCKADKKLPRR